MSKSNKEKGTAVQDEPGAEDRFLRGVRKALETPHKPQKQVAQAPKKKLPKK